jgi:YceI-like domain
VSLQPGVHRLGPDNATLSVRTGRTGAAAKAGHDLLLHVTSWEASIAVGEEPGDTTLELEADAGSLRVIEGTGGMQELGEEDLANIHQTIDDEVLGRQEIAFRSTRVRAEDGGDRLHAEGELTLAGRTEPIAFDLVAGDDDLVRARATVTQTDWGIKPYSALLGALKVADDVEVALEGHLQARLRER